MISKQETGTSVADVPLDTDGSDQGRDIDSEPGGCTSKRLLQQAAARLDAVTDTPRVEAEVLLMHVLDTSRASLLAHPERRLAAEQAARYQDLVSRRASEYPLPYITGRCEFYGLDLEVTPEVMIPRPETETVVDLALERQPSRVVDVGTGSGCIAVALATHLPEATVYGIDISPSALAVACRNAERHGVDDRVRLMVGDVLSPRPSPVELIVSNPPYVSAREWAALPKSIRHFEPRAAHYGGADGLAIIRKLLAQSRGVVEPGGAVLIEIGAGQGRDAVGLAQMFFPSGEAAIRLHADLAGRDRVLEVQT